MIGRRRLCRRGVSFPCTASASSGGIAIGYAHLASNARVEVPQYMLDRKYIKDELARFDEAILTTRAELEILRINIPASAPAELSAFLDMHLMILGDSMLAEEPKRRSSRDRSATPNGR